MKDTYLIKAYGEGGQLLFEFETKAESKRHAIKLAIDSKIDANGQTGIRVGGISASVSVHKLHTYHSIGSELFQTRGKG